jgi:hypothetical protein
MLSSHHCQVIRVSLHQRFAVPFQMPAELQHHLPAADHYKCVLCRLRQPQLRHHELHPPAVLRHNSWLLHRRLL